MQQSITRCATALALTAFALVAHGESPLDEIVVVASKSERQVRDIPFNVSVLGADELQGIGHTHINEAMQRIAGTWISRGNGQEHLTAIRSPVLTGAGSCGAYLMSQDGVPLRAQGFCNVNELFEAASELAERIEVIRGPGSAAHGSNALHGVVDIITPAPAPERRASLEAGSWDYYRGKLHLSSGNTRLDVSATMDGGYKDASGFDQQKMLLKHRWVSDARTMTATFAYTNLNQETAGFVQGNDAYEQAGLRRDNPNPEAYRDARSLRLVGELKQMLNEGELLVRPYLRSVDMQFLQHFLPGQPVEENGHDSIGAQLLWTNGGALRAGFEAETTRAFLTQTQDGPTSGSAFLRATLPAGKHYDYEVDAAMIAAFAEYHANVNQRFAVTAGLRVERMQYDYDNRMLDGRTRDDGSACGFGGCRYHRPADREDTFNELSPKLGFTYELGASHQMYGRLARGFRAPQATELYRLQGGQQVASIDSEQLDSLELGFRGSAGKHQYELDLFAMRKDNVIFRDTERRNVDNGETSHEGVEIAYALTLNDNWVTTWAFTYARHEYANDPALVRTPVKGNRIDTAPRTLGSATLAWQPNDAHRLELEWVHIGGHYTDPQNANRYPGHNLLHLRGSWRPSPKRSLFYRIMNVTNQDYAERADFGFGNERYFVGTPLALFVGVTVEL